MQSFKTQSFDVFGSMKGGNARLYPNSEEQKQKRRDQLAGKDWATEEHIPDLSGFIKIDQEVISQLQQCLQEHGGAFRWNIDASKQANEQGGLKQLKITSWMPKPKSNVHAAPVSHAPINTNTQPAEKQLFNDAIPF